MIVYMIWLPPSELSSHNHVAWISTHLTDNICQDINQRDADKFTLRIFTQEWIYENGFDREPDRVECALMHEDWCRTSAPTITITTLPPRPFCFYVQPLNVALETCGGYSSFTIFFLMRAAIWSLYWFSFYIRSTCSNDSVLFNIHLKFSGEFRAEQIFQISREWSQLPSSLNRISYSSEVKGQRNGINFSKGLKDDPSFVKCREDRSELLLRFLVASRYPLIATATQILTERICET